MKNVINNTLKVSEEAFRLDSVRLYSELSLNKEKHLHEIVKLASELCSTPIAIITLIDETKQHFIVKVGLELEETSREESFCVETIVQEDILMIPDSQLDETFFNNPFVIGEPYIRFYAGIPLKTFEGHTIGSFCVMDQKPKTLSKFQQEALKVLSHQIISNLELRLTLSMINEQKKIIEDGGSYRNKIHVLNAQIKNIIELQSNQIHGPISSLKGLVSLIKSEHREYVHLLEVVVNQLDDEMREIVKLANDSLLDLPS